MTKMWKAALLMVVATLILGLPAANAGKLYATAPEHIKRMLNQVFFEKVLVHAHDDVKPERTPIFEALLSAQTKQLAISSELFGQSLPQKMISYAQCLSKQLLVRFYAEVRTDFRENP